jgi:DNA-binding Lrp family transcriptional regulator
MDEFDEDTFDALRDGKPHTFNQLVEKINFSYNTLRLHLDNLVDQGLVSRERAHLLYILKIVFVRVLKRNIFS